MQVLSRCGLPWWSAMDGDLHEALSFLRDRVVHGHCLAMRKTRAASEGGCIRRPFGEGGFEAFEAFEGEGSKGRGGEGGR